MLTESLSVAQQKATDHIKSLNPGQSLAFIFLSAPPSSLYRWVLALQRNYEAMTLNTPVVSSNASALPEVCGDAALYFDPRDIGAIGRAMVRVIEDQELADKLRHAGKARATLFSWDNAARKFTSFAGRVLAERSKATHN